MKSGHGSCSWKRTRYGSTITTSLTFSRRIFAPFAVEAEPHVLRGEGIAVVEFQPLAELELVDALIRAERPGLGEAGRHEIAGHGLHERVVDGVEHPERGDLAQHLARIEPDG